MRTAQKGLGKANAPAQARTGRFSTGQKTAWEFPFTTCAGRPQLADPSATTRPGTDTRRQPAVFGFRDTVRERPAQEQIGWTGHRGHAPGPARPTPDAGVEPGLPRAQLTEFRAYLTSVVSLAGGGVTETLVP